MVFLELLNESKRVMLKQIGRSRLALFGLIFVSIVTFGTLLVTRFNATAINPTANIVNPANQESQTDPMQPTDKTELAQTELMEPSENVVKAEQAMPAQTAPSYLSACQKMKQLYAQEHANKMQVEGNRHASTVQTIINNYSKSGQSFSSMQKSAQSYEAKRHEQIIKMLNEQFQKQLRQLSC